MLQPRTAAWIETIDLIDMIDRIPLKNEPRLMEAVVQQMQVQLGEGL